MEHGEVTSVNYEDGMVYCDIRPIRYSNPYQNVPVLKSHSGFIQIPKQGETVAIDSLKDGTRFISAVVSREEITPDDMSEGELAIQLDSGTRLRFTKTENGHDVHLDASGDVFINGTNFSEHTHQYDDSTISDTGDGSGTESTESLSTGAPE